MITDQEIKEAARADWEKYYEPHEDWTLAHEPSFQRGAQWAISTMLERASEGFYNWKKNHIAETVGDSEYRDTILANMPETLMEDAWQAATLASEKRIKELELEIENLALDMSRNYKAKQDLSMQHSLSKKREEILVKALEKISSGKDKSFDEKFVMNSDIARQALKDAKDSK